MMSKKKPSIAILTLRNKYQYGGVFSSLRVVYDFCALYFEPTVFFLSFDSDLSTSLKRFKFSSSMQPSVHFGMNCVEIGARWAFWEPGHYAYTLPFWEKALAGFDYFFMVSGTCIAAHPLTLLNKQFVMWVSTLYHTDREKRVQELTGLRRFIDSCAFKKMNSIEKEVLEQASVIFALSSYSEHEFASVLGGPTSRIISCGFPIECPVELTQAPSKEPIIIAVGRFSDPRKNIGMLLRMFEQVHNIIPAARMYVVGEKPIHNLWAGRIDEAALQAVTFTGPVSADELQEFYQQARVQVITSHQEGFGIVGIEGMSFGVPVVSTDCGGTSSYVMNGETGYLVPLDDDASMAQHVITILLNPRMRDYLSRNARTFVQQHYTYDVIYNIFKQGLVRAYPELENLFQMIRLPLQQELLQ